LLYGRAATLDRIDGRSSLLRQDAMTSAQSMQPDGRIRRVRRRTTRALVRFGIALMVLALAGCETNERLQPPIALNSPYPSRQVWAIAPFANESGFSMIRPDRIADLFAAQTEQINGVDVVPVNRVLMAMRKADMHGIATPGDARTLMNLLGVDGLIVGTITAYDPYPPPKLGAAVQLYHRDVEPAPGWLNPIEVTRARTEHVYPGALANNMPTAQASGMFDSTNHETLMQLDQFSAGRTEPGGAYGQRIYLVNMELYTQFVAYRLLHDVLESERIRLMPPPPATQPAAPR